MPVYFHNHERIFNFKKKKKLKQFITELFLQESRILLQLDYIFCSDEYLLNINKVFLEHNYYTDIITFDLSEGRDIKGEIYISIDRVKENAREYSIPYTQELLRVVLHGALHLCGYDDKAPTKKRAMKKRENHYLDLF